MMNSIDQCIIFDFGCSERAHVGTSQSSRVVAGTEGPTLAVLEGWRDVQRYRTGARQVRRPGVQYRHGKGRGLCLSDHVGSGPTACRSFNTISSGHSHFPSILVFSK
jgi:hypothetical protein